MLKPKQKGRPKDDQGGGVLSGSRVSQNVIRGQEQRNLKSGRWGRNRANYMGDPPPRPNAPYEGAPDAHFPIVQVFGDALSSWIVNTVTSIEPYCVPTLKSQGERGEETDDIQKVVEDVQTAVWQELKDAGLRDALKKASQPAAWANAGILWLSWVGEGLRIDVIDPKRFVVYPSCRGIADAVLYGRSFNRTRGEIRALAKKKTDSGFYYFDGEENPDTLVDELTVDSAGGPSKKATAGHPGMTEVTPTQTAVYTEDDLIELHECIVYTPEDGKKWSVTVHVDSETILKKTEYPWKTPCACVVRFKTECTDEFWHEGSVAQDLQGLQADANEAYNRFLDAIEMATLGMAFAEGGTQAKELQIRPGGIYVGPGFSKMVTFAPKVDASPCLEAVQLCLDHANRVTRMSSMGAGGPAKTTGSATAFETQQIVMGQSTGVEDYVANFGTDLPVVFSHVQELVEAFGDVDAGLRAKLKEEFSWSVQVTNPSGTPQMQLGAIQSLYQKAAIPGTNIDVHEVASRELELMERAGITDASGLQLPADPIVAASQLLGIDPNVLGPHVMQAQQEQQLIASQMGTGEPGDSTGMAPEQGAGLLSVLSGNAQGATAGIAGA